VPFPLPQPLFLLLVTLGFTYFMLAGARTFERDDSDDLGSGLGQFSFLCTGALATWFLGRGVVIHLWNGVGALVLLACALLLYEWARRTIRHRRFHIAWSGDVPDALCEAGPYRHVRHPVYLSYMLAFLAMTIALPMIWTVVILLFNVALFTHAGFSEERAIAESPLAEDYAGYRKRVGMFLPRLK
jgi:protein-S-isoprenylcysteine O-methyltransferase Ste14